MKLKQNVAALCEAANEKFRSQFGFYVKDASLPKILDYLYSPKDSSSLAVTRILFGLAMLFDIPDERGGADMENRWGDPNTCHFPLLPFLQAIPMPDMAIVYAGLCFGAIGIMLGYKYRITATIFTVCYWYIILIEKSFWNNHSYLFGLVALLLTFTEANCYWSVDVRRDPSKLQVTVPYWNYFILKYQFFILYFMAGLKKGTAEWLTGYSVQNLSEHWVFAPFQLFMTVPQIDYLIVHWFVFAFDLTIAMWMMWSRTRHLAMVFCAMFHLMNSRLFRIGMFPWVCLATMPLFYPFDWPKVLLRKLECYSTSIKAEICKNIKGFFVKDSCECSLTAEEKNDEYYNKEEEKTMEKIEEYLEDDDDFIDSENVDENENEENENEENENEENENEINENEENEDVENENEENESEENENEENECINSNRKLTFCLIVFHVVTQAFLPYSHFLTKGYNNWTNGLYGYSWDMMVHSWDTHSVIVKIVDNEKQVEHYIDPYLYTPNDRWTRHGDMVHQYARCLKDKIFKASLENEGISKNISVYVDVWCSMNGRFTQRLFDSKTDLLQVEWSPFERMSYVMPLLDEGLNWRDQLDGYRRHVHSWNNYSDVVFLADFPGYEQEKYITSDLTNVTLTVLHGEVIYEPQAKSGQNGYSYKVSTNEYIEVDVEAFHKIKNIGKNPAYYMYTFYNKTEENVPPFSGDTSKLPIVTEITNRAINMLVFANILLNNMIQNVFGLSKLKGKYFNNTKYD